MIRRPASLQRLEGGRGRFAKREPGLDRNSAAERVENFQLRAKPVMSTADVSHKMILLLEYLSLAELQRVAATA